jgi:hypothetical protein
MFQISAILAKQEFFNSHVWFHQLTLGSVLLILICRRVSSRLTGAFRRRKSGIVFRFRRGLPSAYCTVTVNAVFRIKLPDVAVTVTV